ncbi:MAG: Lrp/AsnC family transcriptional regulator [Polyangiales bacterium]|nr:Lrp/AsnC family transcriptional regulator [Myxococcales bacterium]
MDPIDQRLVHALQRDCKTPLAKLGELVCLSAPAVMERVRKLEQTGVIRGYTALVDARSVGLDVTAFVGVSVASPAHIESFEHAISPLPEVLECHHVTGAHTLLLKVKARNTAGLEKLIKTLRAIDGTTRTETMVVLSTAKEDVALPLDASPLPAPKRALRRVQST